MELGIATFVDTDPALGAAGARDRLRELVEQAELAESVGLDVVAVGEHHRADFAVSSPAVVLAALVGKTSRVRLSSAVTVLSSDDPVRVYQDFATLDLLSGGRAEIMAGRGSFTESFPLFGQDLEDYDSLFASKLELLLAVRENERVSWSGPHRPSLVDAGVYPRALQEPLPVWIAVGGTPQSVVRAATLGLPLMVAIIGGEPARFAPLASLYREAFAAGGPEGAALPPIGINSHTYVAETAERAADEFFPSYGGMMSRIGRERGWPPMTRAQFDAGATLHGANFVGSPQQVIEKVLFQHELFGHGRFMIQFSVGTMPHACIMRAIELFGTEVALAVRKEIERRSAAGASAAA